MLKISLYAQKCGFLQGVLLYFICMITACSTEHNYRGVPETTWNQLSAEQKQLIVDRSFQDEIKET